MAVAPPPAGLHTVYKEGWLRKNKDKRWVVLYTDGMAWFSDRPPKGTAKHTLDLALFDVADAPQQGLGAFRLVPLVKRKGRSKEYLFHSKDQAELEGWLSAVSKVRTDRLAAVIYGAKGGWLERNKRQRYFLLRDGCLTWFKDDQHPAIPTEMLSQVGIHGRVVITPQSVVGASAKNPATFVLRVFNPGGKGSHATYSGAASPRAQGTGGSSSWTEVCCKADSVDEMHSWVRNLQRVITDATEKAGGATAGAAVSAVPTRPGTAPKSAPLRGPAATTPSSQAQIDYSTMPGAASMQAAPVGDRRPLGGAGVSSPAALGSGSATGRAGTFRESLDYGGLPESAPAGLSASVGTGSHDTRSSSGSGNEGYGGLPAPAPRRDDDDDDYGGLPSGSALGDYGGLSASGGGQNVAVANRIGAPNLRQSGGDYGDLPSPGAGRLPVGSSPGGGGDYGGLPTPTASGRASAVGPTKPDYELTPPVQKDEDYGGLPAPSALANGVISSKADYELSPTNYEEIQVKKDDPPRSVQSLSGGRDGVQPSAPRVPVTIAAPKRNDKDYEQLDVQAMLLAARTAQGLRTAQGTMPRGDGM